MKTNEITPKVSVIMLAYNHGKYIADAMESVVKQKTDFPFELIIGEDCSTDNTLEIIKKYQEKYKNIHLISDEKNVGIVANELRVMQQCQGKYIAFCEADDFWTDELKLQKQVDFLEKNEDFGLVHADVNHWEQAKNKLEKSVNKSNQIQIPSGNIFEFLMIPSHSIKTMTVCLRRNLLEKYYLQDQEIMQQDWKLIDISIWLMIAKHSKIHYFDEVFATYRLLDESMSRSKNKQKLYEFHQKIYSIFDFFLQKYQCSENVKRTIAVQKGIKTLHYNLLFNQYNLYAKNFDSMKLIESELPKKYKLLRNFIVFKIYYFANRIKQSE